MFKKLAKWIYKISNYFLNFIFKEKCIRCKKDGEIICEECIYLFKLPHDNPNDHIFASFSYKDPSIKKVLKDLKYYGKKNLGYKIGIILYKRMIEEISEIKSLSGDKIILLPIPITKKRMRHRGYNQASLIAEGMCMICEENIFEFKENILIKKIDTIPQAKISDRKKRLVNLKDNFICNDKEKIKGRTVIVVDDITTTGATLNEAMRVLKKSGAKEVFSFVVAH